MFDEKRSIPGEKWVFVDKDYLLSRCALMIDGDDLVCMLSGYHQKTLVGRYKNFKKHTALEVVRKHGITSGDAYWGRHFEDAVFRLYSDLWLDSGYNQSVVLKEIGWKSKAG